MAAFNKVTWVCGWFHGKLSEKDEHYVESTASPVLHVVIHRLTHTHTHIELTHDFYLIVVSLTPYARKQHYS